MKNCRTDGHVFLVAIGNQPVCARCKSPLEWLDASKEISHAATLLDEKLYRRMAPKLKQQSATRVYEKGTQYHSACLFRDALVKKLPVAVGNLRTYKTWKYYQFIKVGDFLFQFAKLDGRRSTDFYELKVVGRG